MATVNKDFIVKNGIVVTGTTATVNNNQVLTEASSINALNDVTITSATTGQVLKYNGTVWVNDADATGGGGGGLTVSDTAPGSPSEGDLWYKSDTGRTYVRYDSYWVEIDTTQAGDTGPQGPAGAAITDIQTKSANYTLALTDANDLIQVSTTATVFVPINSDVPFSTKTEIHLLQTGTGQITVTAGTTGVTVNATPGLKTRAQWSMATLIKLDTNSWVLVGDLSA